MLNTPGNRNTYRSFQKTMLARGGHYFSREKWRRRSGRDRHSNPITIEVNWSQCINQQNAHLFLADNLGTVIQRYWLPFNTTLTGDLFEGDRFSFEKRLMRMGIESQGIFLQASYSNTLAMKKGTKNIQELGGLKPIARHSFLFSYQTAPATSPPRLQSLALDYWGTMIEITELDVLKASYHSRFPRESHHSLIRWYEQGQTTAFIREFRT